MISDSQEHAENRFTGSQTLQPFETDAEEDVNRDGKFMQRVLGKFPCLPLRMPKSGRTASFHPITADFKPIKTMLETGFLSVAETLIRLTQALLFFPEQKSAEIRIHVKQDANRRIPPGRNPGSGGAW